MSPPLLIAILALGAQTAADSPLEAGTSVRIESRVLGETRVVDVALPTRYTAASERRYPVLVVLDGESQFPLATALTRFYSSVGPLPELIVVGVRNTARSRDLSPAPVAGFALAQRPDLFTGYVVMEPATWWNNQRELEEAKAALRRPSGRRTRVAAGRRVPRPVGADRPSRKWRHARAGVPRLGRQRHRA